ncbi:MAG: hypothetical protein ACE363_05890 [Alphaproteobacteria bacterium]
MMKTRLSMITGAVLLLAMPACAEAPVSTANTFDQFKAQFCEANRAQEHIFVLPLASFDEHDSIDCEFGTSGLRKAEPADDPGHVVLNVDPPADVPSAFDCDSKADVGMTYVALNCLPANREAADHQKPE